MRYLSGTELTGDLHLVAVLNEADRLFECRENVVLRNPRTDLYTLYVLGFALVLLGLLACLVLVFAVINDSANRRLSGWSNHDQVEAMFTGNGECLTTAHDAKLFAVGADDANIAKSQNTIIDRGARIRSCISSELPYLQSPQARTNTAHFSQYISDVSLPG